MVASPEVPRNAQQGKVKAAPKRRPSAAKRIIRAGAPLRESSDPMREADAPSTEEVVATLGVVVCPPHRG